MPIYEYRCPNGLPFERFQRMSDPAPDGCEVCGEGPVQVVLYPVAVHFKGSGFYSTDYGKGGRKPAKEAAETGASSTDSSSTSTDAGGGDKATEKTVEKKAAEA